MSELTHFEQHLAGLIEKLSPASRRRLAANIAKQLRISQQQRIKRQQAPDGTLYAARKAQPIRGKKGRVKRAMFVKLRTNRYMTAKGTQEAATVAFVGQVQRMAQVHQEGGRDRAGRLGREVRYERRALIGVSNNDIKEIELTIINCFII
ncbi:phage virion morphogenesis protein [Yersinia enterocolitica]|nr:phage virion morphogenesis protein [Yersinia enterocolitica]EKN4797510.1 phage virion morphogenesis protein [Yersinia enterocolitica]EKN5107804.1 phage virion morphogenesis protein [Yersinia enterocolitica]HDL6770036.1 phage virion morphogenesis protein [Yersinia enterocolitica]